jgi:hypothetical protein
LAILTNGSDTDADNDTNGSDTDADAIARACEVLGASYKTPVPPYGVYGNRSAFYDSYCGPDPVREDYGGNISYCTSLEQRVSASCRARAVPLLTCVAEKETNVVSEDCADVWLGEECDPTVMNPKHVPSPGGLWETCEGTYQVNWDAQDWNQVLLRLPGESNLRCVDGHQYMVDCFVQGDCTMTCDCVVDSRLLKTVDHVELDTLGNSALIACGWTP